MRNRIAVITLLVAACSSPPDAPPIPASLQVTAGNNQLGVPGFLLAQPVSVTLKDGSGNPIAGATIEFTVDNDGVATVTGTAVTDGQGVAQATWRAGVAIGAQQLVARTAAPPALSATATADVRSMRNSGSDAGCRRRPDTRECNRRSSCRSPLQSASPRWPSGRGRDARSQRPVASGASCSAVIRAQSMPA